MEHTVLQELLVGGPKHSFLNRLLSKIGSSNFQHQITTSPACYREYL